MTSSSQYPLRSRDSIFSAANKGPSLNPNAAEFLPSALRHVPTQRKRADLVRTETEKNSGISNLSDDEAHKYWHGQLPDDITPDFNVLGLDDLPFSGLSLNGSQSPIISTTKAQKLDNPSTSRVISRENLFDESISNESWNLSNPKDEAQFSGDFGGSRKDLFSDHISSESMMLDHFEFLSSRFPHFALERIADVYYANGGDLKSTVEMLTQMELKADAGLNQNKSVKSVLTPSLNKLDFHSLHKNGNGSRKFTGHELNIPQHEGFSSFKSPSFSVDSLGSRAFIPNIYGSQSLDGLSDVAKVGPIRNSNLLIGRAYGNSPGKAFLGDTLDGYGKVPMDLVAAQVYSDMRNDTQDLARLRSTLLEPQEKRAYSIGNKALGKGQLCNFSLNEAQEKSMHNQRGQHPLIDLHGLHVNEAMHVLKHELSILRRTAKTAGRRLQVTVCVGVDVPTRSPRPPSRLPAVVQQYLLRENLQFSEDQPGLLRVVIC